MCAKLNFLLMSLFASVTVFGANVIKAEDKVRFAILSDIHIFDSSLLVNDGEAFQNYLVHDRKMLKESKEILNEALQNIIYRKPDFVLFPGDLTKDGELVCHRYVIDSCLNILKQNNIQALVIPGNHDVNNPNAAIFDGDIKTRTTTVSSLEFAELYKDFGYNNALARDSASLSYVYEINDTLRILALDACRYDDNDYEKDYCYYQGRLKKETLTFAKEQLKDAKKKGIRVLCMMHHGLIEHWKYQNKMTPGYVIDGYKKIANSFSENGLEVVFTGHAHTQDISSKKRFGRRIYDIQTASTVSYPISYRFLSLEGDTLDIETMFIDSIPSSVNSNKSLLSHSEDMLTEVVYGMSYDMFPDSIKEDTKSEAASFLTTLFVKYTKGDEKLTDSIKLDIKRLTKKIRKDSFKWSIVFNRAANELLTDTYPTDNNLTIKLSSLKKKR